MRLVDVPQLRLLLTACLTGLDPLWDLVTRLYIHSYMEAAWVCRLVYNATIVALGYGKCAFAVRPEAPPRDRQSSRSYPSSSLFVLPQEMSSMQCAVVCRIWRYLVLT